MSAAGPQHEFVIEDVATSERKEVHDARMSAYADPAVDVTAEPLEVCIALKYHGELQL